MNCQRHEWENVSHATWACKYCEATTHNCHECQDRACEIGDRMCVRCHTYHLRLLADIERAWDEPQAGYEPLRAISYDRPRGGGDHMPFGIGAQQDDPEEVARLAHEQGKQPIELMKDPHQLYEAIVEWAQSWSEILREELNASPLTYLRRRLHWAGNNPENSIWEEYAVVVKVVRGKLMRWSGIAPQRLVAPCIYCGKRTLAQEWGDDGLEDLVRCLGCKVVWQGKAQVDYANLHYVKESPLAHPDARVTLDDVRAIWPTIDPATLRKRKQRGKLQPVIDMRGRELYRVGDLVGLV